MISDLQIREYLLGRLADAPELVEQIDEQILTEAQFSIIVDVVEDEIIEEYIEGSLSPDDAYSVERHFLRPPERQLKLRNARLLSRHLATASPSRESVEQFEPPRRLAPAWIRMFRLSNVRTCAEIAAAAIFVFAIAMLIYQRRELGMALERTNQQLAEKRQQATILHRPLQTPLHIIEPSSGVLSLFEVGLTRGDGHLPAVKVGAASGTLRVEVAVPPDAANKSQRPNRDFRVRLEHDGQTLWSRDGVNAIAVSGGAILKLDLPLEILPIGACELVVKQPGKNDLSYFFVVSDLQ